MHLGFHDVVTHVGEETANACEQIGLVRSIDEYLQAFADAAQTGFDDGQFAVHAMRQQPCMPGDFMRFMAQEIFGVQLCPQQFVDFWADGVQAQRLGGETA